AVSFSAVVSPVNAAVLVERVNLIGCTVGNARHKRLLRGSVAFGAAQIRDVSRDDNRTPSPLVTFRIERLHNYGCRFGPSENLDFDFPLSIERSIHYTTFCVFRAPEHFTATSAN